MRSQRSIVCVFQEIEAKMVNEGTAYDLGSSLVKLLPSILRVMVDGSFLEVFISGLR